MLSKNQIKFIRSLEQKKFRQKHGLFVAEGKKNVSEILNSSLKIHSVYSTSDDFQIKISENELKKISFLTTPNKVLCIAEIPKFPIPDIEKKISLYLDNIKDPGNMGTIIRIADWFGIEDVFCSPECVDAYNPKSVQASMGSIARVKIHFCDAEKIIPSKRNFPVYATVLNGKNIYSEKLTENGLLIIGSESEGISEKLILLADKKISIPSFGKAESLNAAVSAAIICSEFKRKLLALKESGIV